VLFALVPSVSSRIFSAFACDGFAYDDTSGARRYFLHADYSVRCDGASYQTITSTAAALIVLWPAGVPALFGSLLLASHRVELHGQSSALPAAVAFLRAEYTPQFYWWDVLELLRKLSLTGFLLLDPQQYTVLRLVAALLVSIGYLVLLLYASPYDRPTTALLAIGTNLTLTCTFIAALLIKVFVEVPRTAAHTVFGFSSAFPLTLHILVFNVGVLAALVLMLLTIGRQLQRDARAARARRLRLRANNEEVRAPSIPSGHFHVFLSHVWGTGQDQMRIIKQRLLEMIPACVSSLACALSGPTRAAVVSSQFCYGVVLFDVCQTSTTF
jgi:uncharacterized integral membrane protein